LAAPVMPFLLANANAVIGLCVNYFHSEPHFSLKIMTTHLILVILQVSKSCSHVDGTNQVRIGRSKKE
jgi:hypothetical protein